MSLGIKMHGYEIKKGHIKNIEGTKLRELMESLFKNVKEVGGKLHASFGAVSDMQVWTDGKSLFVDMQTNKGVSDEVASKTIKVYNEFLEKATGLTSKERRQRLERKAREGKL